MKFIAAICAALIIAIILLADVNKLPAFIRILYSIPNGDKLGHFILFGILNLVLTLTALSSLRNRAPQRIALNTGLILALLIGLEEFSQHFFASRTSDGSDLFASYAGVAFGGWLAYRRNLCIQ